MVLTLSLTDFAIPAILGGGSQDFIANAIYDQFFRTSDQGMGATLALLLVAVGSVMVGVVFALFGAGHAGHGEVEMKGDRSKAVTLWTFVTIALVMLSAPTLVVLGASFTAGNMITFPPEGLSLKWYAAIAGATDLRDAFLRSVIVATICTAISIPTGTLAGIALAKYRIRFAAGVQVYLLLPFTVPLIGSGIGLMLIFGKWGHARPAVAGGASPAR